MIKKLKYKVQKLKLLIRITYLINFNEIFNKFKRNIK